MPDIDEQLKALKILKESTLPSNPDIYWKHVNELAKKEKSLYDREDRILRDFSRVDDRYTI